MKKVEQLLGKGESGVESWKNLKISDCMIQKNTREYIELAIKTRKITASEVKGCFNINKKFHGIDDDGSSKKGSLRQYRVINKDLF